MTDASIPFADDSQPLRREDIPAEDLHTGFDERQPESQGDSPIEAELGDDGQGDIPAEDAPSSSDGNDGPQDLRVSDQP